MKILTEEQAQKISNCIRTLDMTMNAYCGASEKTKISLTEAIKNTVKEIFEMLND